MAIVKKIALSPIERMIDKACGFEESTAEEVDELTLRCPSCGKEKKIERGDSFRKEAEVVEYRCPDCYKMNPMNDLKMFDGSGKEIQP